MIKVSVLYPNKPGSHFDMNYYLSPITCRWPCGCSARRLRKTEVDQGIQGTAPGEPPAFWGGCQFYFDTIDAFLKAWGPVAARSDRRHPEVHRRGAASSSSTKSSCRCNHRAARPKGLGPGVHEYFPTLVYTAALQRARRAGNSTGSFSRNAGSCVMDDAAGRRWSAEELSGRLYLLRLGALAAASHRPFSPGAQAQAACRPSPPRSSGI
jgi:hypothetical protein